MKKLLFISFLISVISFNTKAFILLEEEETEFVRQPSTGGEAGWQESRRFSTN